MKSARPKRIDWPAARAEYVNNVALTYADIAKKYGAHPGNVGQRAARENWTAERQDRTKNLLQKVIEKSTFDAVAELAKYNEQDLIAAKALRGSAARKLQEGALQPQDLRALAGAIESAQRIARLALGASTENSMIANAAPSPIDLSSLSDEDFAALQFLVAKAASADRTGSEAPGSGRVQ